uniref:Uncharacterized protein n=1 Tax=Haemonchus placei TaxID=6290 RepID=A0A0N4W5R9_HAEPC
MWRICGCTWYPAHQLSQKLAFIWEVSGRRFGAVSKIKPLVLVHCGIAWQTLESNQPPRQSLQATRDSLTKNSNKNMPYLPEAERVPDKAALRANTARQRLVKSQDQNSLPKRRRTRMAICASIARTLASDACIEDLVMQARKIKYDVIGLTEARRHRRCTLHFRLERN